VNPTAARQVILVRHAHAEWPDYRGRDFDRPLTRRGESDALLTARAIGAAGHRPALVLASPALRTRQTTMAIATELEIGDQGIQFIDSLYNAGADTLADELRKATLAVHGLVMLVAHNPGISELGHRLGDDQTIRNFRPADWRVFPASAL
jgi:phosphohistidine phosphatase